MNTRSGAMPRQDYASPRWLVGLPLAVIVLIVAGAIAALLVSSRFERDQRGEQLISDTLWAEQAIDFESQRLIEAMRIMGRDLDAAPDDVVLFQRRAADLLQRSVEARALCRVVSGLPSQSCLPAYSGNDMPNAAAGRAQVWRDTLERALRLGRPAATLLGGDGTRHDLLLAVPVPGSQHVHALLAVVSLERLLNSTLPWWFAHDNEVTLTDLDGNLLAVRDASVKGLGVYTHRIEAGVADQAFYLNANSTHGLPHLVPNMLTGVVIALSLLLAWSAWLLWRDLVRRSRAENALREQQALRQAMEDSLVSGLRARDLDGRITYVNPAFCEMVGYGPEDLIGHGPDMPYLALELKDRSRQRHAQLMAGTLSNKACESTYVRRDGTRLTVLVSEAPLLDGAGKQTGWMASIIDMTEQKRAQEFQHQQNERMNHMARLMTMGEMASALAHELNQPLAAINSYCTAALNVMAHGGGNDTESCGLIDKARSQAERAGRIIRRVHHFVRKTEPLPGPVALDEVIAELLHLIRLQTARAGEPIQMSIPATLPRVLADRVLLEQVLLNLTRNAFEAMAQLPPSERRVIISADLVQAGESATAVCVSVRDWGAGLTQENALQAMESPFFTTKSDGMGMGLAVCRSALELMGSRLQYRGGEGGGACFYFDLKVLEGQS
ncbi:PAS domain S-box protein [Castellaniella sp. MT123]|uniref:PAS domain S-box protein n=1 Tax=Castellaniella sp. MT123 TaxID=3140381 RepID=UPI0031F371A3